MHTKFYIKDYPRPQMVREQWQILDGRWDFGFDKDNSGEGKGFSKGFKKECDIQVPYSYESEASGVFCNEAVENIWYSRNIILTKEQLNSRVMLNFEGVDYFCKVWINGQLAGSHSGGYSRFSINISEFAKEGQNLIVVKAEDSFSTDYPRGKQRWLDRNFGCWYTQTTGIWKSVWVEFLNSDTAISFLKITPILEQAAIELIAEIDGNMPSDNLTLEAEISFQGKCLRTASMSVYQNTVKMLINVESEFVENQINYWSPNCPSLYDIELKLKLNNQVLDRVGSYFGFRSFAGEGTSLKLNNNPYYQKLILYQGYWDKTLLTVPCEKDIIKDIQIIKELGYNGIRIHQKIEDERFLYYADTMGLLVWCEMPSPHCFSERAKRLFETEWKEILYQNYNHPSIITWVIYNESWGIRQIAHNKEQQAFVDAMYYFTKSYDTMRPVISNDGWEHTISDILTLHNYEQDAEKLYGFYQNLDKVLDSSVPELPQLAPYANGYTYKGEPVIFSEFGGCCFKKDNENGNWGYGQAVNGLDDFYERFESQIDAVKKLKYCAGYCYTQFTDVEQEKNGLLTIDRQHKTDPQRIKKINDK